MIFFTKTLKGTRNVTNDRNIMENKTTNSEPLSLAKLKKLHMILTLNTKDSSNKRKRIKQEETIAIKLMFRCLGILKGPKSAKLITLTTRRSIVEKNTSVDFFDLTEIIL